MPARIFHLTSTCRLILSLGDLTDFKGDAIVNAANERMLGGGGVDGAIHRRAGPQLKEACFDVPEVRRKVRCPTGEARITPGFDLPARFVIHTVGPVYECPEDSAPLLAAAYRNSLTLANENGFKSIAFPAISCGVYGYPLDEAAEISVATCQAHAGGLEAIHFVLFGDSFFSAYLGAGEPCWERGL